MLLDKIYNVVYHHQFDRNQPSNSGVTELDRLIRVKETSVVQLHILDVYISETS